MLDALPRPPDVAAQLPSAPNGAAAARTAAFIEGVVQQGCCHVVADHDRLAVLPSQVAPRQALVLSWSSENEAARWADVLAQQPRLVTLDVVTLLSQTLPALAAIGGRIGPDWSADSIEPELDAADLGDRLRAGLAAAFVSRVTATRTLWVLDHADGAATCDTAQGPVVPVWSDRTFAEAIATHEAFHTDLRQVSLAEFTGRTLLSAGVVTSRIAPAFVPGHAGPTFTPWQLKALLGGYRPAIVAPGTLARMKLGLGG
jgi:hypothetical protein